MANGKREFEIKINGITESIDGVTKLVDALGKVGNTEKTVTVETEKSNKVRKEKNQALTEEEKAQKKLEEILRKTLTVESETNKAYIEATTRLREKTREVTRDIQLSSQAEGSIKQMGMRLTDLRNNYESLSAEQRNNREEGGKLLAQIQELDAEYKSLRESTGNFRDSVGNYEKALGKTGGQLRTFGDDVEKTAKLGQGLAQTFLLGTGVLGLFGTESEDSAKQVAYLQKMVGLLSLAQAINTGLLKNDMVVKKAASVIDGVRLIQTKALTKAKELETKQTVAATIAQKALNAVASANPYVLLGLAILTLVGAIGAYAVSASDATGKTKRYKSAIDDVSFSSKEARDAHDDLSRKIRDIQIDIDVATGKLSQYEAAIIRVKNAGKDALAEIDKEEQDKLDKLKEDHLDFFNTVGWLAKNAFTTWDTSFSDKRLKEYLDNQEKIFAEYNDRRKKQRGLNEDDETRTAVQTAENVKKINEDNWNETVKGVQGTLFKIQTARKREEEDAIAKNKVIAEANKTRNKDEQLALVDLDAIRVKYDKQREEAIKAENQKNTEAGKIRLEAQKRRLETEINLIRQAEDTKTELIINDFDQREEQIRLKYSRQKQDLEKRLNEDKKLTEEGRNAIREIINSIAERETNDLKKINEERVKDNEARLEKQKELWNKVRAYNAGQSDKELANLERFLTDAQQRIGDIEVRDKNGLQLINVEATRKNLNETDKVLTEYISKIGRARDEIKALHEANIKNLKEGTPEYENELNRYADAEYALNQKLAEANKAKEENTKQTTDLMLSYWQEFFSKVSEQITAGMGGITDIFDAVGSVYQSQLDELNEKYDEIAERYDEVEKKREDSANRVKEYEQQIQQAQGGTALALREQIALEMQAKAELDREEKRLAKEKEKREAEIARKEKQLKKAQLISDIATATAGVASAIVNALNTKPFLLGLALASVAGVSGAVQIGVMTRQLAKMEDGGLLAGPSHANGGMRIQGTNIEVEGGEYVINKRSTARNQQLIEYINSTSETVSARDVANLQGLPIGYYHNTPDVQVRDTYTTEDKILEAIKGIDFRPVVSVKDINDVQSNMVDVADIAGTD